jgi:hypothetical protein
MRHERCDVPSVAVGVGDHAARNGERHLGLTDGVHAFAEELRAGGHTVHTLDLFDGQRPASSDDGMG